MTAMIEANIDSVLDFVRQLPPADRASLVTAIVETLVAQPEIVAEESDPTQHTPEELATIYQLRREWEENRRRRLAGEIELDHPRPSPYEGMTQEEALAQMKAEWETKRDARRRKRIVPKPVNIIAELYGIASSDVPGPSDEEVEQWLHEHRMEKYG